MAQMPRTPVIAVLGLGEAGSHIARDLAAAGAVVRGYDPRVPAGDGLTQADSEADAAAGAGLILSVNSSADAVAALRAGVESAGRDAVWADLNTASPGKKRELADLAVAGGVVFADIAIMAPVPGRGLGVPMLASGAGAEVAARMLSSFGATVDVLDGEPGLAASRKLLRSVFFKGMSAAVVEALEAARAAGCQEWLKDNIITEFTRAGELTVDRMVDGTHRHAVRRAAEMAAAADMLTELNVDNDVAAASREQLNRLSQRDTLDE